jgi:hypothetical protein
VCCVAIFHSHFVPHAEFGTDKPVVTPIRFQSVFSGLQREGELSTVRHVMLSPLPDDGERWMRHSNHGYSSAAQINGA